MNDRTVRFISVLALAAGPWLVACGDDDGTGGNGEGGGTGGDGTGGDGTTTGGDGGDGGAGEGGEGGGLSAQSFTVRIQNVSADAAIPTAISPGVWVAHAAPAPLFDGETVDRGEGLERIAEDGNPTDLDASLGDAADIADHGIFDIPDGAATPGPALPGGAFTFTVTASPDAPNLTFATMFGQSNDVFIAPYETGIALFDEAGKPIAAQDVTSQIALWDVGSEVNQAPGNGPLQAPRQPAPNTGYAEGALEIFADSTRSLPSGAQIGRVQVEPNADGFAVTISNVSGNGSSAESPISPVFFAVHDDTWSLFQAGSPDQGSGLEALAEDGNPMLLVASYTGAPGVAQAGAATIPNGNANAGPALPGQSFTFQVTPTTDARYLSLATMVGQSNDAFLAFDEKGVALLDEQGQPRSAADLAADLDKRLAVWDAGTEANEVPGAGLTQAPRQGSPNTGPADPVDQVRRYADPTNDLAGPSAGGVASVTVASAGPNSFLVTVTNTSGATPYPTGLSPMLYALHDGSYELVSTGDVASVGVERLAEDGNASEWLAEVEAATGVASADIVGTAPISNGQAFQFTVNVTAQARVLNLGTMIGTSNDTFLALGAVGVELADALGNPRAIADINADLASALGAWDAGTEANQASAVGPDQGPRQDAPNTGAGEGSGLVRVVDQVWAYPASSELVRVTIEVED